MAIIDISQLPPAPALTGSGVPKGTDLIPGTDVTAITPSTPTGVTYKYTQASMLNFYLYALGYYVYLATRVATTGNLTAIYSNGTAGVGATLTNSGAFEPITIDSVALSLNDRVLVWSQSNNVQNGLYYVSTVGDNVAVNWVLTRTTDFNTTAQIIQFGLVFVNQGSTYAGRLFEETADTPITIGTNAITFALFSFATQSNFTWNDITGSSADMVPNNGYIADFGSLVTLTLPTSAAFGTELAVCGKGSGLFTVVTNAGQSIVFGEVTATTSVASMLASDSLRLVCTIANTQWTLTGGPQGSFTIT